MSTPNSLPQTQHPSLESEQRAHEPSMEEILASIRRIIADDDALPLMRRPAPSLVTREPDAVAMRHPSAPGPSAPPVHLVALTSGESEPAESAGEPPTTAVHADPLGTGFE